MRVCYDKQKFERQVSETIMIATLNKENSGRCKHGGNSYLQISQTSIFDGSHHLHLHPFGLRC